jgi:ribonuclease HI
LKKVVAYSDGGCRGNPGPGGWGVVLEHAEQRKELSGGSPATTNNRMELQAAIEALSSLKQPCEVEFYTDSKYVQNGISLWIANWKRNGWKTSAKLPVKNADLWRALDTAAAAHRIKWHWLKGHAGHEENERCDVLANEAIDRIQREHSPAELKKLLSDFAGPATSETEQILL